MICDHVSSTSQLKGDNICGARFGVLSRRSTCRASLCMLLTSCGDFSVFFD